MEKHIRVNDNNVRLDRYIRKFFPKITQSAIEKFLRKGLIKVDNCKAKSNDRISVGQIITVKHIPACNITDHVDSKKEKIVNTKLIQLLQQSILYEDEYIVAINKSEGIVVQGGKTSISDVLSNIQDGETLKIVHRIDRDTSGIVIFARDAAVAKYLMEEFKKRKIEKTYLALTVGIPHESSGVIDCPLVKQYVSGQEKVIVDVNASQNAITYFSILNTLKHDVAYLKLKPITGRTHQLRVHLAHINCPILGDGKYGGKKAFITGIINKMHLHAHMLSLTLPNNREIMLTAPIPKHIEVSVDTLNVVEN